MNRRLGLEDIQIYMTVMYIFSRLPRVARVRKQCYGKQLLLLLSLFNGVARKKQRFSMMFPSKKYSALARGGVSPFLGA